MYRDEGCYIQINVLQFTDVSNKFTCSLPTATSRAKVHKEVLIDEKVRINVHHSPKH